MGIIKKVQKQDAIYWPPVGANDDGSKKYGRPVAIKCRWEQKVQQVVLPNGESVTSNHHLITSVLLEPGGMVVLGTHKSIKFPSNPSKNGSEEIQTVAHTPNIKQTKHLYEAWL